MGKQPGKAIARLEDFDRSKYLVLHEATFQRQGETVSPVLYETVRIIQANPDPEGPDVYVAWWTKGKLAPRAHLLRRVGTAAGLRWSAPVIDGPHRDPATGHKRVTVTAEAAIRDVNGEWVSLPQSKHIDTADLEEKWLEEAREKAAEKRKKGEHAASEDWIRDSVRRRILQMKEKLVPEAETKAMSRVLRGLLGVQQDYTPQEMRRPIVVPVLRYRPDVATAIDQGHRAVGELYGGSPGGPLGQDAPSSSLSTAEEPPRDQPAAGGVATGRGAGVDTGSPSEATPAGAELKEPSDDPVIEDPGQYKGERMSHLADVAPDYLRAIAAQGRTKKLRELAQAWLDYTGPTQQSLGG